MDSRSRVKNGLGHLSARSGSLPSPPTHDSHSAKRHTTRTPADGQHAHRSAPMTQPAQCPGTGVLSHPATSPPGRPSTAPCPAHTPRPGWGCSRGSESPPQTAQLPHTPREAAASQRQRKLSPTMRAGGPQAATHPSKARLLHRCHVTEPHTRFQAPGIQGSRDKTTPGPDAVFQQNKIKLQRLGAPFDGSPPLPEAAARDTGSRPPPRCGLSLPRRGVPPPRPRLVVTAGGSQRSPCRLLQHPPPAPAPGRCPGATTGQEADRPTPSSVSTALSSWGGGGGIAARHRAAAGRSRVAAFGPGVLHTVFLTSGDGFAFSPQAGPWEAQPLW